MDFTNQILAEQLRSMRFNIKRAGKTIYMAAPLSSLSKMVSAIQSSQFNLPNNGAKAKGYFIMGSDDWDDSWRGGTPEDLKRDLAGGIDMRPFLLQKDKLSKGQLLKKIIPKLAEINPRRRRTMSEHDGEWDFSRRWEIAPFAATKRAMGTGRTIDVNCHMGISATSSAEEINDYGATAWAICDLLENAGIPARITCSYYANQISSGGLNLRSRIEVKQPGSYLAPNALAAVFQANFFRRVIFASFQVAADLLQDKTLDSLGSPQRIACPIEFRDGEIVMSPDVLHASGAEISAVLLQAITGQKAVA